MIHEVYFYTEEIVIIRLVGELDHHATKTIRESLSNSLFTGKLKTIIWNLENLSFMDSSGIGLILGRMKDFAPINGTTIIIHPSATMRKILQFAGLHHYISDQNENEVLTTLEESSWTMK